MKQAYSFLTVFLIVSNFSLAQNFWQEIYSGDLNNRFSLNISSNGYLYFISDTFLIRSTDSGISWHNIHTIPSNQSAFGTSPTGVIYLNSDSLLKSTDEGNSWENVFCCYLPWFIITNNDGDIFIETGSLIGGGANRSTDEGSSWMQIGIQPYFLLDIVFKNNLTFASFFDGFGGQLFKSTNKGDNWELVSTAPANLDILFVSKNGYLYGGRSSIQPDFLFRSTDDGLTWNSVGQSVFTNRIADIEENQLGHLFVSSPGLGVFRSTDNGDSWLAINSGFSSLNPSKIAVDSLGYLYVINDSFQKLYRSIQSTIPVELIQFNSLVIDNYVLLNWITATETNNSGFEIERNTPLNPLSRGDAEGRGVWKRIGFLSGSGTTTELQTYSYKDENLSAGKYQYRLKQIDFDGTFEYSKTIEVEINPPAKFSLEQNYPNPFNPSTNIQYSIANRQFVTLKVFDVLGNEVATLVNEEKPAGNYEVEFNPINLSSGVYYYRLKAGEFIKTKKMILLK